MQAGWPKGDMQMQLALTGSFARLPLKSQTPRNDIDVLWETHWPQHLWPEHAAVAHLHAGGCQP